MPEGSFPRVPAGTDPTDLRASARTFLEFERGYLRRRWAAYYALWAGTAAAYFVAAYVLSFTSFSALPSTTQLLTLWGLRFVLTIVALTVSVLIWGLAERTSALRVATSGHPSLVGPLNLIRFAIVVTVIIAALLVSLRSSFASDIIGDTALLVLTLFLFLHLHYAFRPIPPEGWLAASAFISAGVLAYISLLLGYPLGHVIVWSAAVVVWSGCAAYARFGAHDVPENP